MGTPYHYPPDASANPNQQQRYQYYQFQYPYQQPQSYAPNRPSQQQFAQASPPPHIQAQNAAANVQPVVQQYLAELDDTHVQPTSKPKPPATVPSSGLKYPTDSAQSPSGDPVGFMSELPGEEVIAKPQVGAATGAGPRVAAQANPWGFFLEDQPAPTSTLRPSAHLTQKPLSNQNSTNYQANPWGYFGSEEGLDATATNSSNNAAPPSIPSRPDGRADGPNADRPPVPILTKPRPEDDAKVPAQEHRVTDDPLQMGAMALTLPTEDLGTETEHTSPMDPALMPAALKIIRPASASPPPSRMQFQPYSPPRSPPRLEGIAPQFKPYVPPDSQSMSDPAGPHQIQAQSSPATSIEKASISQAVIKPYHSPGESPKAALTNPSSKPMSPVEHPPSTQNAVTTATVSDSTTTHSTIPEEEIAQPQVPAPLDNTPLVPLHALGRSEEVASESPPPFPPRPVPQTLYASVYDSLGPTATATQYTPAVDPSMSTLHQYGLIGHPEQDAGSFLPGPGGITAPPPTMDPTQSLPQPPFGNPMPNLPSQFPSPRPVMGHAYSSPTQNYQTGPQSPPMGFPPPLIEQHSGPAETFVHSPQHNYNLPASTPPLSHASTMPQNSLQQPSTHRPELHHTTSLPADQPHSPPPPYHHVVGAAPGPPHSAPLIHPDGMSPLGSPMGSPQGPYMPPLTAHQTGLLGPMSPLMTAQPQLGLQPPPLPPRPLSAMGGSPPTLNFGGQFSPPQHQPFMPPPLPYGPGPMSFTGPPSGPMKPKPSKLFSRDTLGNLVNKTTQIIDQTVQDINQRYGTPYRPQTTQPYGGAPYYPGSQPQYGYGGAHPPYR